MPTTAPKTRPYATLPAAQPITAPRTMHAAVNPKRTPPAPASWKFGREAGSISSGAAYLVPVERPWRSRVLSKLVTRVVFVHGSVAGAEPTFGAQRALSGRFDCVFVT